VPTFYTEKKILQYCKKNQNVYSSHKNMKLKTTNNKKSVSTFFKQSIKKTILFNCWKITRIMGIKISMFKILYNNSKICIEPSIFSIFFSKCNPILSITIISNSRQFQTSSIDTFKIDIMQKLKWIIWKAGLSTLKWSYTLYETVWKSNNESSKVKSTSS